MQKALVSCDSFIIMKQILPKNTSEVPIFKTMYLQPVGDLVQYFFIIAAIYIKSYIKAMIR